MSRSSLSICVLFQSGCADRPAKCSGAMPNMYCVQIFYICVFYAFNFFHVSFRTVSSFFSFRIGWTTPTLLLPSRDKAAEQLSRRRCSCSMPPSIGRSSRLFWTFYFRNEPYSPTEWYATRFFRSIRTWKIVNSFRFLPYAFERGYICTLWSTAYFGSFWIVSTDLKIVCFQ